MGIRALRRLPPPTPAEREQAAVAAAALLLWLDDPRTRGTPQVTHLDFSRPRRGEWHVTWPNVPGFLQVNDRFSHALLPGWQYTREEVVAEMIPDLVTLAERGERPTVATSKPEGRC